MGEVRCATAGFGSSWKLSGGNMWSAAVTKVSKKRQVRRAIRRSARASAAETDTRPATSGERLVQRAMAGAASQAITNGAATSQASLPTQPTTIAATTAMATPPLICR